MDNYPARAKEEICITGFTVYYNWLLRMNNVFQVFGAMGAKIGPLDPHAGGANIQMQNNPSKQPDEDAHASFIPNESSTTTPAR